MKQISKNFDKHFPLWKACNCDGIRPALAYIKFDNGYAYATTSYILVKARLTDISDFDEQDLALLEGMFIHANNFKKIVKSKGKVTISEDAIIVEEENCSIRYPLKTDKEIRFPDCEKVLNDCGDITLQKEFGINADYLNTLNEVMYSYNGIQMEWKSNHMFMVRPIGTKNDIKGIIMTKRY